MSGLSFAPRFAMAVDISALAPDLAEGLRNVLPEAQWDSLVVTKALPHKSGGYAVQYTVNQADGSVAHLGGLLTADPQDRPTWADGRRGVAWLPDLGLAVAMPGYDPKLKGVAAVLEPAWTTALAEKLGCPDKPGSAPEILTYRFGKRCVLRLRWGAETAIVKLVRPGKLGKLVEAHEKTAIELELTVPEILHVDHRVGALVMTEIRGTGLNVVGAEAALPAYAAAGRMLRNYHTLAFPSAAKRTVGDELAQLSAWCDRASGLFPDLAGDLALGQARLTSLPVPVARYTVRLHRDFYDKQVIVGDEGDVALLDLDTSIAGDAALDLGNFMAHVHLRKLQTADEGLLPAAVSDAFLKGYGPDNETRDRLVWWQTAALLRLAVVYSLRPRWRTMVLPLLKELELCVSS